MMSENANTVAPQGRLLGLDYGQRRVGLAVSDFEQHIASPLKTLARGGAESDLRTLNRIIGDHSIVGLIVGLPVHMSGDEGASATAARQFGEWVGQATHLPICFWDERFSSARADSLLQSQSLSREQRKKRRDAVAAMVILQSFLDCDDRTQAPQAL